METPTSKEKEKILVKKESELKWEEDVDAAIEEVISKVARTEEAVWETSLQVSLLRNRQQQHLHKLLHNKPQ